MSDTDTSGADNGVGGKLGGVFGRDGVVFERCFGLGHVEYRGLQNLVVDLGFGEQNGKPM